MRVGWVGLGKLGLPCAVTLASVGHEVTGTDANPEVEKYLVNREVPYREEGLPELLATHTVRWASTVAEVVAASDVVFVAVQTPHDPAYDGTKPAPAERKDFEYGFLVNAVRQVCTAAQEQQHHVTVVVVSTVLPGTFNRHLRPLANPFASFVYNPFFIAMGTTVADFCRPEFVLIGADGESGAEALRAVYRNLHHGAPPPEEWTPSGPSQRTIPRHVVSIETAELTKVAYNTFISLKVAFANVMGELCHKTGADCDDLIDGLSLATDRIISPRYLRAGMGDGGGCHPRDNIAMSWLAEQTDLSFDLFAAAMDARESHSRWLASVVDSWARLTGLRVVVLGKAYKPGTNLTVGSPAALLVGDLAAVHVWWDPHVDDFWFPDAVPSVYVAATQHPEFRDLDYPAGSIVIDPFGYIPDQDGVTVVRLGRKR